MTMGISEGTTTTRREEIVNACEKLYRTMSFREITLKEISEETSFSRPSIYNYFATKEEIFLALFEREYDRWNASLEEIHRGRRVLSSHAFAEKVAKSLSARPQLLKLLSMNNYDMEENSREECLTSFKRAYGRSLKLVKEILDKFCPEMTEERKQRFLYVFFPFMFGIYPYAAVTEKQKSAMKAENVDYRYQTVYEITYACLTRLLGE